MNAVFRFNYEHTSRERWLGNFSSPCRHRPEWNRATAEVFSIIRNFKFDLHDHNRGAFFQKGFRVIQALFHVYHKRFRRRSRARNLSFAMCDFFFLRSRHNFWSHMISLFWFPSMHRRFNFHATCCFAIIYNLRETFPTLFETQIVKLKSETTW